MTNGKPTRLFVSYSAILLAVHARVLVDLVDFSRTDPTASYLVLIPFVSWALVAMRRESIFSGVRMDGRLAIAPIAAGAALAWYGARLDMSDHAVNALTVRVLALVVFWIGGFLLCYGRSSCAAARFPLTFLLLMVPVPAILLDGAVQMLKTGSAETVAALLSLAGTPFQRSGFMFSLPSDVNILIADECSGIRSSIGLFLTSLLAGDIFLRTGWKKALLVAATVPLAVLKNGVRIVTLVELSIHVSPDFLMGELHYEGGFVFYFLALLFAAPLFLVLQASDRKRVVL